MADETETSPQKMVEMPRAVHELRTGKGPGNVIVPGTIITDAIAKKHKLDDETMLALIATGAVNVAEVLTV
ncbi:hypothetical protein IFT82_14840 [Sphingomonas sp. CFBP 8760]|nr:hypothetical protein [Sphingomonas sp. CFBP 8760]